MPSKCIADKPLKTLEGKSFKGFQIFGGKHSGQYIQGETYPEDYLARKYKYDFELVEVKPPGESPKKKLKEKDSGNLSPPEKGGHS